MSTSQTRRWSNESRQHAEPTERSATAATWVALGVIAAVAYVVGVATAGTVGGLLLQAAMGVGLR